MFSVALSVGGPRGPASRAYPRRGGVARRRALRSSDFPPPARAGSGPPPLRDPCSLRPPPLPRQARCRSNLDDAARLDRSPGPRRGGWRSWSSRVRRPRRGWAGIAGFHRRLPWESLTAKHALHMQRVFGRSLLGGLLRDSASPNRQQLLAGSGPPVLLCRSSVLPGARVAQLARASASGAEGCGFKPRPAYHSCRPSPGPWPALSPIFRCRLGRSGERFAWNPRTERTP